MVAPSIPLATLALLASYVIGAPVVRPDFLKKRDSPGYHRINFDVLRGSSFSDASQKNVAKLVQGVDSTGSVSAQLTNENTFYSVPVEIGSNSDKVTILIDTGSSDMWVPGPNAGETQYGTFDSSKSTTWHSNETSFHISYGDNTYADGTWGTDNVRFGDVVIENLSFAVAEKTDSTPSVLGIGLEGLESTMQGNSGYTYHNLPSKMAIDGHINRNAYSLWLNEASASTGVCLFGAVDHAKYDGTLSIVPIVNAYADQGVDFLTYLFVTLSSISFGSNGQTTEVTNTKLAALLDSGTTLTYFPADVISAIAKQINASYNDQYKVHTLDCSAVNQDDFLTYNFQGIDIKVPLTEVIQAVDNTQQTCALMMMEGDTTILGDSFLRSAYVVYDLEGGEIAMAQASYSTEENIEVISDKIPSATTAAQYAATYTP